MGHEDIVRLLLRAGAKVQPIKQELETIFNKEKRTDEKKKHARS
jgi:hypothetical protein